MSPTASDFDPFYRRWSLGQAVLMLLGLLSLSLPGFPWLWWAAALASFLYFFAGMRPFLPAWPGLGWGYANWISAARGLGLFVGIALAPLASPLFLFTYFLILICLDGVDGLVARTYGHSHALGERFDMEIDAALVHWLAWWHVADGLVGYWLLVPGALKYVFTLLMALVPQVQLPDYPPKRVRSTIAVVFFVSLITPWLFPPPLAYWTLVVASAGIILSFAAAWLALWFPKRFRPGT